MKHRMDCNTADVIYLITCTACRLQYVGSSVKFKPRFREHKSDIKLKKKTKCRTADHWASCHSNLDSLEIMLIEKFLMINMLWKLFYKNAKFIGSTL